MMINWQTIDEVVDRKDLYEYLISTNKSYKQALLDIKEYIEEWQRFPHTNGSTHRELKKIEKQIEDLQHQLETSEKTRKEAIKYIKKTSGYDNPYNDTFLNTYAVDNLLEILDKGE